MTDDHNEDQFCSEDERCEDACNGFGCYLQPCTVILITVLILLGNTVGIVALATCKSLRDRHGYFLLSLAISDLCTTFVSATSVYPSIVRKWPFSHILCDVTAFLQGFLSEVSLTMIAGMSIERYIAVFYPLQIRRWLTNRRLLLAIMCSWVFLFAIKMFLFFNRYIQTEYDEDLYACLLDSSNGNLVILIITYTVIEVPAFFTISYLSVRVIVHIWRRGRSRDRHRGNVMVSARRNPQWQQTVTVLKVIIIITLTFYLTWIPFIILRILYTSDEDTADQTKRQNDIPQWVEFISYWLLISSSFINVFVYFFVHKKFRTHVKYLFKNLPSSCFKVFTARDGTTDIESSLAEEYQTQIVVPGTCLINDETVTTIL